MKKLLFVTGTRADFSKLEPLAKSALKENYNVGFFVTGMHMLTRYGLTKLEVERVESADIMEFINQREGDGQEVILAKTISGFSDYLKEYTPDLVIIHGDRIEAIGAALVCAINYVRSVHIEGGEVSGNIDEIYRHCNTKLCTAHFVSSATARDRVIRLGENPDSIFVLGSPELDIHSQDTGLGLDQVLEYYRIKWKDYAIVIFHPVTFEIEKIGKHAEILFRALEESGRKFIIISPNNDPGYESIFNIVGKLPKEQFHLIPSMRFSYFSELLRNAGLIIGNSSVGVREAPFLGIPSLDIGTRQNHRSLSKNVSTVNPEDSNSIKSFIDDNWGKRHKSDLSFGIGKAVETFIKILSMQEFWDLPLQKYFHDEILT